MTTATQTPAREAQQVAETIRKQIGVMTFMTLGASDLAYTTEQRGGLTFKARILPFTKKGERSYAPRVMRVEVVLTGADLYDVKVYWMRKFEVVEHFTAEGVDAFALSNMLYALDYDGDEVLNPRI